MFTIGLQHSEPYVWRSHETELLHELAARLFVRLDRARAERMVAEDYEDTQQLRDLALRLLGEDDIYVLYQEILTAAIHLTRADGGTVQILDQAKQELVLLATQGFPAHIVERFFRVDARSNTSCGLSLNSGTRTLVDFDVPASDDPDGSRRIHVEAGYLSAQSTPLITRSGTPIGMVSTHWRMHRRPSERELRFLDLLARQAADLIEQRQSQEALRHSEERFRTLSNAVPQVIWANTGDGRADYFNQRWYEYSGLSYQESVDLGWQAIVHPEDAPASVEQWQNALSSGEIFDTEYRLRRFDGVYRWHIGRNVPLRDANGTITGWFGSATDIEERKQAESLLQESEERFRLLVEGAKDYAMFLLNRDGLITFWSAGAERLFGWTEAEVLGQHPQFIFTPEDRQKKEVEIEIETALLTGRATDRRWHLRKDASRFWADGILMRLQDEATGILRGFAKVARDATEQKKSEEAIRHALEAVAQANEELETRVQERTHQLSERTEELARMSELRQELLRQLVTAQEQEQARLARDLHDDTGQQMTALLLGLKNLQNMPAIAKNQEAQTVLASLQALAGDVAQKSHRISFTLRPTALDDVGLLPALRYYTEEWSRWSERPVNIQTIGMENADGSTVRLPTEIETTIYRVTQESLTNILKHAISVSNTSNSDDEQRSSQEPFKSASQVSLLIQRRNNEILVIIEDDGPGFDIEAVMSLPPGQRRLGIFGMQERARLAGGSLSIESIIAQGTTVYLRLPLLRPSRNH
jgi:PAS domain S-box-containing protein